MIFFEAGVVVGVSSEELPGEEGARSEAAFLAAVLRPVVALDILGAMLKAGEEGREESDAARENSEEEEYVEAVRMAIGWDVKVVWCSLLSV